MAKKTKSSKPQPAASPAILDWSRSGLGPVSWMGAAWMDGMGKIGTEITRFVTLRIQEDVRTQQKVLACRDPAELQKIQAEFLERAFAQYTEETGKLVEMNQDMLAEMMSASGKQSD